MPSMSGWVLRGHSSASRCDRHGFYALDVGLGVARQAKRLGPIRNSFYALDVGLGVASYQRSKGITA